jgi:hypothetical protein
MVKGKELAVEANGYELEYSDDLASSEHNVQAQAANFCSHSLSWWHVSQPAATTTPLELPSQRGAHNEASNGFNTSSDAQAAQTPRSPHEPAPLDGGTNGSDAMRCDASGCRAPAPMPNRCRLPFARNEFCMHGNLLCCPWEPEVQSCTRTMVAVTKNHPACVTASSWLGGQGMHMCGVAAKRFGGDWGLEPRGLHQVCVRLSRACPDPMEC